MIARRFLSLALAFVAAVGLVSLPQAATPVRAATPDLTIVGDARYVVQPEDRRVRVTVDLHLTNRLQDTTTRRFYFDHAFLAVLPGTSGFRLTGEGSTSPSVGVNQRTRTHTVLRLGFPRLYGGQSVDYRLRFDLVDPGGAPVRDVRVGTALVSFPVWGFASDSTSGGSVTVVLPEGYQAQVEAGSLPKPTTDSQGRTVFRTGRLADPLDLFAYIVADRPAAYATSVVSVDVAGTPVTLTMKSWPDDEPWAKRVGGLARRALPVLNEAIGLPWPREDGLVIQEAVSRSTGGYAGLFDPEAGFVEVAYYAGDGVVLHEAAHAWFNGSLLADRWANEAFASYYGGVAAEVLEIDAPAPPLTDAQLDSRIPLNDWGSVGSEAIDEEDYAYAASLTLAKAIADRVGEPGLQATWAAAAARTGAYQPPAGATERVGEAPDWRGLLDLLEEHGAAPVEDLWRTWVARPGDLPLLDARAAARDRYDAVVAEASGWRLPRAVRDAMRAWQFEQATALLGAADGVLDQRTRIEAAAEESGLTVPRTLRDAFEGDGVMSDGFTAAAAEATAQLAAIDRYRESAATRLTSPDLVEQLGLLGTEPDAHLARARTAFAEGDLEGSAEAAADAAADWQDARPVGQGRLVSIVALTLAVIFSIMAFVAWARGRRRRRVVRTATAGHSYARLAATRDPLTRTSVFRQARKRDEGAERD